MKKIVLTFVLSIIGLVGFAQSNIQLTLKWNSTANKYEVYANPAFTQSAFTLGASQISIVVPSAVADAKLVVTTIAGGTWSEEGVPVYSPLAQVANDFHPITTSGAAINFTSGTETLLFTFTLSTGLCSDGVRIYVNGSDPSSSGAGMNGIDLKNSLEAGAGIEYYQSNYNNIGTQCSVCNIAAPELSKQ